MKAAATNRASVRRHAVPRRHWRRARSATPSGWRRPCARRATRSPRCAKKSTSSAPRPATYGVVSLRQRGRHRQHPVPGPQGEGQPPPGHQGGDAQARPGADPQRGPQRHRGRRLRDPGRGRHPQGAARPRARARHPARRRGQGRHHRRPAAQPAPEDRRPPADGRQERLPAREAAEERGRGPVARGSARHRLRRRSAASATRSRPSRTPSSCRTSTPTTTRSTSSRRPRACCSTALPAAARP